jgi:hypothetical protein
MAKNIRAFSKRQRPGKCPSCGKMALGKSQPLMVNSALGRWRKCGKCGESVMVEPSTRTRKGTADDF